MDYIGVCAGVYIDIYRDVCTDDYIGNCRAVVEPFIELFVETIVRLPSISVLRISRASSRALRGRPPWTPLRTACSIYYVAGALTEALVEHLVERLVELL